MLPLHFGSPFLMNYQTLTTAANRLPTDFNKWITSPYNRVKEDGKADHLPSC